MNLLTLVTIAFAGWHYLAEPVSEYRRLKRSELGVRAFTSADSAVDLLGGRHPILSKDSATFVLILDTDCGSCRIHATSYPTFAKWSNSQRAAVRLLVPNSRVKAAQFDRLAHGGNSILMADQAMYVRLGIAEVPTVLLVDRRGVVHGRWAGAVPVQLARLKALNAAR